MNTNVPRIKRLRRALKWSQARMAEYIGLTQAAVSLIENGARESGPVSKLLDQLEAQVDAQVDAQGAAAVYRPVPPPQSGEAA